MEHSVTPLSSALGKGEANGVSDHPNHVDTKAEVKANKQRRKIQNRKNQRAHHKSFLNALPPTKLISFKRLQIKEQDLGSVQISHPFQVRH